MKNNEEIEPVIDIAEAHENGADARAAKVRRPALAGREGAGAHPDSPAALEDETVFDLSLRPRSLGDFVGQDRLKKILGMSICGSAPAR